MDNVELFVVETDPRRGDIFPLYRTLPSGSVIFTVQEVTAPNNLFVVTSYLTPDSV
ncbi:hypothetical protein GCM10007870_20250 [Gluconobacter kondonii]|uniref:Uncharacterized protein n=1 Tax=Gluconobacter kondonii TaxID=941463 RepID=A0ABQ5WSM6_9PROT|nr:hypothetical protein GCM10007870_20250 [Gluconobacter kondonii]